MSLESPRAIGDYRRAGCTGWPMDAISGLRRADVDGIPFDDIDVNAAGYGTHTVGDQAGVLR